MFERENLIELYDYFKGYNERENKGVFFCRLTCYDHNVEKFLLSYFSDARKFNGYIREKIKNPDRRQLSFFEENVGNAFEMELSFFNNSIKKWLPRLNTVQIKNISEALFFVLKNLADEGKNVDIIKNTYIKFMCWFYYKFEQILSFLGNNNPPKILYEGKMSDYEAKMMIILSKSGCDIVVVDKSQNGTTTNPNDLKYAQLVQVSNGKTFEESYSVFDIAMKKPTNEKQNDFGGRKGITLTSRNSQALRTDLGNAQEAKAQQRRMNIQISGERKDCHEKASSAKNELNYIISTNTWIFGELWQESLKSHDKRGDEKNYVYNMFVRIRGVDEKDEYLKELLKWKIKLESISRTTLLIEKKIPMPEFSEVNAVARTQYSTVAQMLSSISSNIKFPKCKDIEDFVKKAFVDVMY